ncbi:30S ribosomal protein S3 [Helcococcus kunzii]|uniref:Small ribosomal subunit protein uS3 n=1 Tax=Helcococcus kunzii ATCC 51366 TaxID=883114 RepID=H3NP62_9FIRM|nr:30S ribosomal protein S3 [Helcococcus kunzii]EHR33524.1 ribosomal protein S3 [Helcococcus kunzii ATCC 51366]MCT1795786.1 30S ribosomal protein S3 [Helcococcus kunzii]MCT1989365.1 30S ribosomal protein S3 [Helcococcus kunzii]QUY65028.1 30S ribosomal protein S3 [Helcococcus kunzii]QZO75735.1 30S ribosomal protein S3 [Helcococcus kunzii]
MGQKVNPHGMRVGIIKDWNSKWFADKKEFSKLLAEDNKIRNYVKRSQFQAGVSKIDIERTLNRIKVTVNTAKPGMIIGKGGAGVEELKNALEKMTKKQVIVNVEEVKNTAVNAQLQAERIASDLERRITFRRAMKQAIQTTMKAGAKGMKTQVSGRLGGADMARTEGYSEGNIPLQTLRADIDYGFAEADTTYGKLGVKVWIYKGEILPGQKAVEEVRPNNPKRNNRNNRSRNNRSNKQD